MHEIRWIPGIRFFPLRREAKYLDSALEKPNKNQRRKSFGVILHHQLMSWRLILMGLTYRKMKGEWGFIVRDHKGTSVAAGVGRISVLHDVLSVENQCMPGSSIFRNGSGYVSDSTRNRINNFSRGSPVMHAPMIFQPMVFCLRNQNFLCSRILLGLTLSMCLILLTRVCLSSIALVAWIGTRVDPIFRLIPANNLYNP